MTTDGLSRRHALTGAATVGIAAPFLTACGGEGDSDPDSGVSPSTGATGPGGVLASTSDVEVGGGTIFPDEKVVVTQPTEGDFKAFSSTCTHQGCQVASVTDGLIHCPCHGSRFSIEDGSVAGGPAPSPLAEVELSIEGDEISIA